MSSVVVRVERNRNYKTIALDCINDTSLSWKAKGLHAYLISRPDGWEFNTKDLLNRSTDGAAANKSARDELEEAGYLTVHQGKDESGKFQRPTWVVREKSEEVSQNSPECGFPLAGNPQTEFPLADNPPLSSKEGSKLQEGNNILVDDDDDVEKVFNYWRTRRDEALGLNTTARMILTVKRRGRINARLREGYTVEQLKEAVDGCLLSDYNVKNGFVDIELICRDQSHVDQYRSWKRNGGKADPPDVRRSRNEFNKQPRSVNSVLEEFSVVR